MSSISETVVNAFYEWMQLMIGSGNHVSQPEFISGGLRFVIWPGDHDCLFRIGKDGRSFYGMTIEYLFHGNIEQEEELLSDGAILVSLRVKPTAATGYLTNSFGLRLCA